jgi:hypothetical protein
MTRGLQIKECTNLINELTALATSPSIPNAISTSSSVVAAPATESSPQATPSTALLERLERISAPTTSLPTVGADEAGSKQQDDQLRNQQKQLAPAE